MGRNPRTYETHRGGRVTVILLFVVIALCAVGGVIWYFVSQAQPGDTLPVSQSVAELGNSAGSDSGATTQASLPAYSGPTVPETEGPRAFLLAPGAQYDPTADAGTLGQTLDRLLAHAAVIGCDTVFVETLYQGKVLYPSDRLPAMRDDLDLMALAADKAEAYGLHCYAVYHLLDQTDGAAVPIAALDADTLDEVYGDAVAFAVRYPSVDGVAVADYLHLDGDATYAYYKQVGDDVGIDRFLVDNTLALLTAAQRGFAVTKPELRVGAVIAANQLPDALQRSKYNAFALLAAPDSERLYDVESAQAWRALFGRETAVYALYNAAAGFEALAAQQAGMSSLELCEGYVLPALPTEGQADLSAASKSAESGISASEPIVIVAPDGSSGSGEDASGTDAESPESGGVTLTDPKDVQPLLDETSFTVDAFKLKRPSSTKGSTTASVLLFTGVAPVGSTVTLDGEPVELDQYGNFAHDVPLVMGYNIIYLNVDGDVTEFHYTRNQLNVMSYMPQNAVTAEGGATLEVSVTARAGSIVSAELNGETIALSTNGSSGFCIYRGAFQLPESTEETQELGVITYTVEYEGADASFTSDEIAVNPTPPVETRMVEMKNDGTGKQDHALVLTYPVLPTDPDFPDVLNYDAAAYATWRQFPLPNGAKDVVVGNQVTYGGTEFYVLQSGVRVKASDTVPVEHPEHYGDNVIHSMTMVNDGTYSNLLFDTDWEIPYTCSYTEETFSITFGSTVEVPSNLDFSKTPVFTKGEWDGNTLTLTFRTPDGFLGFIPSYTADGDLLFRFTNPPESGGIEGARITVDPGHGGLGLDGADPGGVGCGVTDEAGFNMCIGTYLDMYLKELGADPLLLPTYTQVINIAERLQYSKAHQTQIHFSIHHNAGSTDNAYGVITYYFQDFSPSFAQIVQDHIYPIHDAYIPMGDTHDNGISQARYLFTLHPGWNSLMLENGFVSSGDTYTVLHDAEFQAACSRALALALEEYFSRFAAVAHWPTGAESTLADPAAVAAAFAPSDSAASDNSSENP